LLVIVVTALVILGLGAIDLVPQRASAEGEYVDIMFQAQIYVIAFIFSLIVVLMLYSIVVFRRRPGDTGDGAYVKGSVPLEVAWTVIPLIIVLGFGVWGAQHLTEITGAEPNELLIEVTGFQYGWSFAYPEYGVTSSELYLPSGRQVHFLLTSRDVIHSFWVPEFRIKQDAVPGRWTHLRVTPTEVGNYRVRCAELCGYAHAAMYAPVIVVEPEEFENWVEGQEVSGPPPEDLPPAERGARLVEDQGCLSCHSTDGSDMVGPTWLNLYGSERPLEDGSTVVADEEYLRIAIVEPTEQIVAGYPNVMPPTYGTLSDEDIEDMIAFIESLGEGGN
jgi:cytochrome c oxidase subunit 2